MLLKTPGSIPLAYISATMAFKITQLLAYEVVDQAQVDTGLVSTFSHIRDTETAYNPLIF